MEKKIIGTWALSDIDLINITGIAQTMLDLQHGMFDQQIEAFNKQIEITEDETEREAYKTQKEDIEAQKAEITLESIITEFNNEFENMKNEDFNIIFTENKEYTMPLSGEEGTWYIDKKKSNLHLFFGDEKQIADVQILNKNTLNLIFESGEGENRMLINFIFTKSE